MLLVFDIDELGYREVGPISAIVDRLIREFDRGVYRGVYFGMGISFCSAQK